MSACHSRYKYFFFSPYLPWCAPLPQSEDHEAMKRHFQRQRAQILTPPDIAAERLIAHPVPANKSSKRDNGELRKLTATTSSTQSSVIALVKVVDTDSGESKLVLNDEALTVIRGIKGPVSVIAIAGAYRYVMCNKNQIWY